MSLFSVFSRVEKGNAFTELHGINHKNLIGFLAGNIEQGRQWNSLNQHAAAEIGHIKLFDVMPAEEQVFGMLNMI